MATRRGTAAVLADPISAELKQVLRTLKLGKLLDILPERLTLARQQNLPHADFLEHVLADEVNRRDTNSTALRVRAAGLDPSMRLKPGTPPAAVLVATLALQPSAHASSATRTINLPVIDDEVLKLSVQPPPPDNRFKVGDCILFDSSVTLSDPASSAVRSAGSTTTSPRPRPTNSISGMRRSGSRRWEAS